MKIKKSIGLCFEHEKINYNYVFNRYIPNLVTSLIKVVTGRETLEFLEAKVGQVLGKQSTALVPFLFHCLSASKLNSMSLSKNNMRQHNKEEI